MNAKRGASPDGKHGEQKRLKVSSGQSSTAPSPPGATEPAGVTTEVNAGASVASKEVGKFVEDPVVTYEAEQEALEEGRVPPTSAEFADLYSTDSPNFTFVDNSTFISNTMKKGKTKCLLIRPRRSGKSTFGRLWLEFLRGNKKLFEKLTVGSSEVPAKGEYVCVHLDLSDLELEDFVDFLVTELNTALKFAQLPPISAQRNGKAAIRAFSKTVQEAGKRAAFFVDEYDYLVQNANSSDIERAKKQTESIFVSLKAHGMVCTHLFITGSSRIAISGIYTGANNIADVSYKAQWATVLGYTWQDIERLYSKQLVMLQQVHGLTPEALKEKIEQWYNGYQFSHRSNATVYSIWAINRLLESGEFAPHLSKSGLSCQLVTGELIVSELAMMVHKDYSVPSDIDEIEMWRYGDKVSLVSSQVTLLSAGLLTFRGGASNELSLAVPNQDCRTAIDKVLWRFAKGINVKEFGLKIMSEDILGAIGILQPEMHKMARSAAENAAGAEGVLEYHLQQAFFSLLCTLQQRNRTAQWAISSEVRVKRGTSPLADFLLKMNFAAGMRYHVIEFGIHRNGNPFSTLSDKLEQALSKYIEVAQNPDHTSITAVLWDTEGGLVRGAGPLSAKETGTLCVGLKGAGSPPDAVRVARSDGTGWL